MMKKLLVLAFIVFLAAGCKLGTVGHAFESASSADERNIANFIRASSMQSITFYVNPNADPLQVQSVANFAGKFGISSFDDIEYFDASSDGGIVILNLQDAVAKSSLDLASPGLSSAIPLSPGKVSVSLIGSDSNYNLVIIAYNINSLQGFFQWMQSKSDLYSALGSAKKLIYDNGVLLCEDGTAAGQCSSVSVGKKCESLQLVSSQSCAPPSTTPVSSASAAPSQLVSVTRTLPSSFTPGTPATISLRVAVNDPTQDIVMFSVYETLPSGWAYQSTSGLAVGAFEVQSNPTKILFLFDGGAAEGGMGNAIPSSVDFSYSIIPSASSGSISGQTAVDKYSSDAQAVYTTASAASSAPSCNPKTCAADYAGQCGAFNNGCQGNITCSCSAGYHCTSGSCVADCTPLAACPAGKTCGIISNNCGGTLSCGVCPSGSHCESNACLPDCIPRACSDMGLSCGAMNNGCGSTENCGTCSSTQTCNQGVCIDKDSDSDGDPDSADCAPDNAAVSHGALEVCDGIDNNCDSKTDKGSSGNSLTRPCGTDTGECAAGIETCTAGQYSGCTAIQQSAELCDGKDNDCNGVIDNGVSNCCQAGEQKPCSLGVCTGTQTCSGGSFGACQYTIQPGSQPELCDNRLDDDCDGQADEGCAPLSAILSDVRSKAKNAMITIGNDGPDKSVAITIAGSLGIQSTNIFSSAFCANNDLSNINVIFSVGGACVHSLTAVLDNAPFSADVKNPACSSTIPLNVGKVVLHRSTQVCGKAVDVVVVAGSGFVQTRLAGNYLKDPSNLLGSKGVEIQGSFTEVALAGSTRRVGQ